MKRSVWQTIKNSCVIFTVITLLFYTLGLTISKDMIPTIGNIVAFLGFSLGLAFINEIFFIKKLSMVVKLILHYFATGTLVLLLFAIAGAIDASGPMTIIIMFAYSVLYWIGGIIALIINKSVSSKKNDNEKYESMLK